MNALKLAIIERITSDAESLSIAGTSSVLLYDKMAPQDGTSTQEYPYGILAIQGERPEYHHAGKAAAVYQFMVKWIDRGESSRRAGLLDERTEELLHPNDRLEVTGFRTGFQARTSRIDFTEPSSGVKYQHVGGMYRITLIPQ